MTELPRIRRHTDGRVALCFEPESDQDHWRIFEERPRYCFTGSIIGPLGEGWSELFVAELPELDNWIACDGDDGEDARTPTWRTSWGESVTAWIEGIETPVWELTENLDAIRADALKMLAAVAACERFRAEREAT